MTLPAISHLYISFDNPPFVISLCYSHHFCVRSTKAHNTLQPVYIYICPTDVCVSFSRTHSTHTARNATLLLCGWAALLPLNFYWGKKKGFLYFGKSTSEMFPHKQYCSIYKKNKKTQRYNYCLSLCGFQHEGPWPAAVRGHAWDGERAGKRAFSPPAPQVRKRGNNGVRETKERERLIGSCECVRSVCSSHFSHGTTGRDADGKQLCACVSTLVGVCRHKCEKKYKVKREGELKREQAYIDLSRIDFCVVEYWYYVKEKDKKTCLTT